MVDTAVIVPAFMAISVEFFAFYHLEVFSHVCPSILSHIMQQTAKKPCKFRRTITLLNCEGLIMHEEIKNNRHLSSIFEIICMHLGFN